MHTMLIIRSLSPRKQHCLTVSRMARGKYKLLVCSSISETSLVTTDGKGREQRREKKKFIVCDHVIAKSERTGKDILMYPSLLG